MKPRLRRGCVQVYTGDGKGKSTAAFGLAVRASGAGLRVFIGQFLKSGSFSEIEGLKRLGRRVTVRQFGTGSFVRGKPSPAERRAARRGVAVVRNVLKLHRADVVILDEINVAVKLGLVPFRSLLGLLAVRPADVELILTGRYADRRLLERADLVTEMRCVKHYYSAGIPARVGIEK